jgi:hypothetical protein
MDLLQSAVARVPEVRIRRCLTVGVTELRQTRGFAVVAEAKRANRIDETLEAAERVEARGICHAAERPRRDTAEGVVRVRESVVRQWPDPGIDEVVKSPDLNQSRAYRRPGPGAVA